MIKQHENDRLFMPLLLRTVLGLGASVYLECHTGKKSQSVLPLTSQHVELTALATFVSQCLENVHFSLLWCVEKKQDANKILIFN